MKGLRSQHPQTGTGPPITPTLAWYDSSDASTVHASSPPTVDTWDDKSGNGHHLTPIVFGCLTGYAPTINGLNVMDMHTGANRGMASSTFTLAQPITALMVVKTTPTAGTVSLGNTATNPTLLFYIANGWSMYAGTVLGDTVAGDSNAHVFGGIFNGSSSALYLDATNTDSGNAGTSGYSSEAIILGSNSVNTSAWVGVIGEVLMYSSALSGADYLAAQAYLKAKWGTP